MQVVGKQKLVSGQRREQEHCKQGRQNAARAAFVKGCDREAVFPDIFEEDPGNEEAGYDKEDVYPDKATRNVKNARVKQNDGNNGDGSETVDIRPMLHANSSSRVEPFHAGRNSAPFG